MSSKPEEFDVVALRAKNKPNQSFTLGEGLELWEVPIAMLQEQSLNARAMTPEAFLQLADNIKKDKRLESLPLCALTNKGVEIVSGHHRVRAARKAELNVIWALVDVTNMATDRLKAKQLSHNSLQGKDDPTLVRQIYDSIDDLDAKIAAFINSDDLPDLKLSSVELSTKDLEIQFKTRYAVLMFTVPQKEVVNEALKSLAALEKDDEIFLATVEEYDLVIKALDAVSVLAKITSTPTLFAKMAEIVQEYCKVHANDAPK